MKKLNKMQRKMINEMLLQQMAVSTIRKIIFYPEWSVDFEFPAVAGSQLASWYDMVAIRKPVSDSILNNKPDRLEDIEYLDEEVWRRRQKLRENKSGYAQVLFDKGMVQFGPDKFKLGNTVCLFQWEGEEVRAFFNEGDRCNMQIYFEKGSNETFLVMWEEDETNAVSILLDEFYMLGLCSGEKNGLMVEYSCNHANIYWEYVIDTIFDPISFLLTRVPLLEEWKYAKEEWMGIEA